MPDLWLHYNVYSIVQSQSTFLKSFILEVHDLAIH